MKYSNFRLEAEIADWPFGRQTCTARFTVEADPKRGSRVSRVTENKSRNGWNKPKKTTYCRFGMVLADGDDGRIYALGVSEFGGVVIWEGTLKTTEYDRDNEELRGRVMRFSKGEL